MRWKGRSRSENVEDRRGQRAVMVGGGGIGIMIIAAIAMFLGADPQPLLDAAAKQRQQQQLQVPAGQAAPDDDIREFISVVLHDTETVWERLFATHVNQPYRAPKLILFSDSVRSACGPANASVGPFYCPADQQVYVPPSFFEQLKRRHNAPGDFAQAYVIAHEVAHHVQYLLGYSQKVSQIRRQGNELATNRASVRLELQADYLAGVWAHHAQRRYNILERGDIEEALQAANQIGDDTLQRQATGYVVPERFTHGTSAQRVKWFRAGLSSGDFAGATQLFELEYSQL